MNLCSGGATVSLVAELTGLTGNTGTRTGSELKAEGQVWKDDIKNVIKKLQQDLKLFQSHCYDEFNLYDVGNLKWFC